MGGTGKTVSHGRELLLDKQVWSRRKQAGLGLCLAVEPRIPGLCCVVWHLCGCNVFHWEGLLQLVTTKPPIFGWADCFIVKTGVQIRTHSSALSFHLEGWAVLLAKRK
jgi:hypothetical protein